MRCLFRACLGIVWINTVNPEGESLKLEDQASQNIYPKRVKPVAQK